jgi:CXXC-20-CXXC protein
VKYINRKYKKMKKCEKCKTPFSFRIIYKSFWGGYKNFACTNCQSQYKFNTKDRLIGGSVVGLTTFISVIIMNSFVLEIISKLSLGLVAMVVSGISLSALSTSFFSFELDKN